MKTIEAMVRSARDVTIALFVYVIFLVGSGSLLLRVHVASLWEILIAVSPIIPVAFVLRAIIQLLQHSDELQQRIQLFAIVFSAAATGLLTFAYGLLEDQGYPPIHTAFILPLMVILWLIGVIYFKWRFR